MKPKILLVDDDKNLLHTYQRKFRNEFFVYPYSDALSALEYLNKNKDINLIISDFKMPGMNGVQFLAKAKQILPNSSRILITGHADLNVVINSINEGNIFRFLTKPFSDETLFKAINDGLRYNKLQKIEASDNLKNEFLSLISHEIRTPLSKIINYLQLVDEELKNSSNDTIKDYMSIINNSSTRFLRTIDLIVKTAEVISGNYKPNFEKLDLITDIISPLKELFEVKAINKNLEFNLKSNVEHFYSFFDKSSLSFSLTQLIENAITYTKQGKVELIFDSKDGNFKLDISDTGPGMSEEFINKIFIPFAQETSGYTRKYEGNGLGLTIAKYYLDINNIKLTLKSKKNVGTTCRLIFNS